MLALNELKHSGSILIKHLFKVNAKNSDKLFPDQGSTVKGTVRALKKRCGGRDREREDGKRGLGGPICDIGPLRRYFGPVAVGRRYTHTHPHKHTYTRSTHCVVVAAQSGQRGRETVQWAAVFRRTFCWQHPGSGLTWLTQLGGNGRDIRGRTNSVRLF